MDFDLNLPIYRAIDFGFANPFVCLWIQVDKDNCVRVIDEYIKSRVTVSAHAEEIKKRTPVDESRVTASYCDPAGASANDVTGQSSVKELRSSGIMLKYRKSFILQGIELIRKAINTADGKTSLLVSPKCPRLIQAMQSYHYPESGGELPLKDGVHDHPIDALRYFFVNHSGHSKTIIRRY